MFQRILIVVILLRKMSVRIIMLYLAVNKNFDLNHLKILWGELGVTEIFRNYFEIICKELDSNLKKEYVDFELNSLRRLIEQIQVK